LPDPRKYEKQFFAALGDIFVGAKVEGDSGYINLMHIKSRYYDQGVFPQLQKDINAALNPFPDFREELFDKLYTFFQRYFSESGSIYFRYTALHQNVSEKVYTDDRDVMLFWKTHMLFYVKTDRIFTSLNVDVEGVRFFFDASRMVLKKANEKRETVYAFRNAEADGTLVFDVAYSEKGKTTKLDEILKDAKLAGHKLTGETLSQAFRVFEKQSEVDYFINKNARAFLQEQFELWMYHYLFSGQNIMEHRAPGAVTNFERDRLQGN
jgi:adenine-specific DNA-methyltransferase